MSNLPIYVRPYTRVMCVGYPLNTFHSSRPCMPFYHPNPVRLRTFLCTYTFPARIYSLHRRTRKHVAYTHTCTIEIWDLVIVCTCECITGTTIWYSDYLWSKQCLVIILKIIITQDTTLYATLPPHSHYGKVHYYLSESAKICYHVSHPHATL